MLINIVPWVRAIESTLFQIQETAKTHFSLFLIGLGLSFAAAWIVTFVFTLMGLGISFDTISTADHAQLTKYAVQVITWMDGPTIGAQYVSLVYYVSRAGENLIWVGAILKAVEWWSHRNETTRKANTRV
jgi:hypothetical protein